jgi:hypothetical protein
MGGWLMGSVRFVPSVFLLPLIAGLGAAACAQFALYPTADAEGQVGGAGTSVGSGYGLTPESSGAGASTGAGGGTQGPVLLPMMGSYSYLCGDSNSLCTVGTDDCAQGGNTNPNGGAPDGSALACQIVPDGNDVRAQCGMAGFGTDGDVCATVADCQDGFGCVVSEESTSVGVCRAYCCVDLESCATEQYCSPISIYGFGGQSIPVCVAASMCQLLEDAKDCPKGMTCSIVRADGTTTCVVPGTAVEGDACTGSAGPCAAGYYCSPATGTCLELCHTEGGTECGPGGTCQGGTAPFPDGIGFCVF